MNTRAIKEVKKLSAMSPSETEILRLLWQLGTGTVRQVCERLPTTRTVAYATVQTLLRRLEHKGYVRHRTKGKAHVFFPAVEPEKVIQRTVGDFVDRLFGGNPAPLMLHLADHGRLDADTIQRLKQLINGNKV